MRAARSVAISLVIGLIITVGLAWCCVMVAPAPNGGKVVDRRSDPAHRSLHQTADDFGVQRETIAIISDSPGTVPGVTILNTTADQWLRAGWPWLALECANDRNISAPMGYGPLWQSKTGQRGLRHGLAVSDVLDALNRRVWRALPLRPMWPGFALDWALFSVVLFAFIALPRRLRALHRRQAGLCVACGYQVRGGDTTTERCPECGTPVAAHVRRTPPPQ